MERRKFLIGAGSLAAGSAAAVGTGAFTSVEADRTVSVAVAGDASAYLALAETSSENSEYVKTTDGQVSFDFTDSNGGESGNLGNGFNKDATTQINDLLKVTNQGTQEISFWVETPYASQVDNYVDLKASNNASSSSNFNSADSASSDLIGDSSGSGATAATLSPGDSIYLHLTADSEGIPNWVDTLNGQSITFHAEATSGNNSGGT